MIAAFLKNEVASWLCSLIPLDLWHRLVDVDILVPLWHVVSDQELAHISGLYTYRNERQFTADIDFLLKRYAPVCLNDVLLYLDGYGSLPPRPILFTFDDGFREVYDIIAPFLFRKGIPGVFFPITAAIDNHELCYPQKMSLVKKALPRLDTSPVSREISRRLTDAGINGRSLAVQLRGIGYRKRHLLDEVGSILGYNFQSYVAAVQPYLTSEQIRELLKKGFAFGAHSVDHPRYSELSLEEQLAQTRASVEFISSRYGYECNTLALPYSDRGISPVFFDRVFSADFLKATFGIDGITSCLNPRHLPRISIERTDLSAGRILARQFGRTLLRRDPRSKIGH